MKNKTTYTYELLLKMNLFHTARGRRNCLIYFFVMSTLSIGLIIADLLIENFHTLYVGMFFLALSLVMIFAVIGNRKEKIAETIKKQIQDNPNKVIEYYFDEDYITITQTSTYVQSEVRTAYSYIAKIAKIDETSFYFVTKNNLFYVLEDEQNIDQFLSYLCDKVKEYY